MRVAPKFILEKREPTNAGMQYKKVQDDNDQDAFHSFEEDHDDDSFGSDIPRHDSDLHIHIDENYEKKFKENESKAKSTMQSDDEKRYKDILALSKTEKAKTFDWSSQRLLLIVELLAINGGINKFRNGKVKSIEGLPISIKSFMISTALSLFEATRERIATVEDEVADHSISKKSKLFETKNVYDKYSFLNYQELVPNILSLDFKHAGYETNPLLAYLNEKNCDHISAFLKTYQK